VQSHPQASPSHNQSPNQPGGLWAFYKGKLLCLHYDEMPLKTDHVRWFRSIGLPDHGCDFDRILRGRMTWDRDRDFFILVFYDTMHLPNYVYQKVNKEFNPTGARVIERPVKTDWSGTY